ncbi:MAG: potassium-transporting ATPase subunit KdpB [Ignavibacteriaceae bacterium]
MENVLNTIEPELKTDSSEGQNKPPRKVKSQKLLEKKTAIAAIKQAFIMLRPDIQWRNPVMFVVEVGSFLTLFFILQTIFTGSGSQVPLSYFISLDAWLFLTVLFANFATALAEARGKAHADSLRRVRHDTVAYKVNSTGNVEEVSSNDLKPGDIVVVETGQIIPSDGEIIEGIASIDESAITGESAPVIRESGGDRSGVTGGTIVLSDKIKVQITSGAGDSFLDRMIALVEGAIRQRSPNEIALTLVLSAFTLIFLIVVIPLWPMAWNAEQYMTTYLGLSQPLHSLGTDIPTLIALLVCLIPTTIGALLAAIGIAGMDRALQANIIAKSGKAVELAGDIDVVLLDKTGTITLGNRRAVDFIPTFGVPAAALADAAQLSSLSDDTPEGRSIVVLAKEKYQIRARQLNKLGVTFIPFSAQTRMSGVDLQDGRCIRKGSVDAIELYVKALDGSLPADVYRVVEEIAKTGGTPLVVADREKVLGVVHLKDIVKTGIKERFAHLRKMGVKSVMITGDNRLTAAAIAIEAGVDDFLAEAKPEDKLAYIRKEQAEGKLVAMMGDGTNDAPALAQGDVALAMNAGTQAAKEAANMVDLDSDPTKLIEVVEIGKQLLMTRGALTTFSIANDVAKYFAIIPALFAGTLPWLKIIDIMHLHSATSAIMSAVIFNAVIIPVLIPVALKGVKYRALGADSLLLRNLLFWGLGGVLLPFFGIKLIDIILTSFQFFS